MAAEQTEPSFQVVMNTEEQYSIWPVGRAIPDGWVACDLTGTQEACLSYIERVWTDTRPLSLRRYIQAREPG
jgi:MbtH protein